MRNVVNVVNERAREREERIEWRISLYNVWAVVSNSFGICLYFLFPGYLKNMARCGSLDMHFDLHMFICARHTQTQIAYNRIRIWHGFLCQLLRYRYIMQFAKGKQKANDFIILYSHCLTVTQQCESKGGNVCVEVVKSAFACNAKKCWTEIAWSDK